MTIVEFPVQRVSCLHCGKTRQVRIFFADPNRRYTRAFERYVLELCRRMTIRDVARHLGISWHTVKDIFKRHLQKRFSSPPLKALKRIAIDEISVGSAHRYLTLVLDLHTGAVVFVGKGKGADALNPFWKQLRACGARIEAVALDMSQAYIRAVSTNVPRAAMVFDHFHVIKLFNDKLAELRRNLSQETTDLTEKRVLKGTRWLLLKNPGNLCDQRNERARLEEALSINKPLAAAYYMKEDLGILWSLPDKSAAQAHLKDWIARAQSSGIRILKDMAKTLSRHERGILAYYDYPISTGPLEGTNNKIKTLQRQAYGFRDREFFILRIYSLHSTKYKLIG